jgi:hypothetical protein
MELKESRKAAIKAARSKIRKLFEQAEEIEAPEGDVEAPVDGTEPVEGAPVVEVPVEVTDTKITLSPEQWDQVVATADVASEAPPEGDMGDADAPVADETAEIDPTQPVA